MRASDFECPTCGAEVSPNATGCRSCGAEKIDGRWGDPATYDGLDLPGDDDFDYDDFIAREFGGAPKKKAKDIFWWAIAVIVLVAFAAIAFRVR